MNHRIISRIDIKGPNLVKGVHLEGLRVLGKPEKFAKYYYQEGIDELIYQDVVASLYERNSLEKIIEKTAEKIFIPMTVGGGIRNLNDIHRILRAGADKVSINTAAIKKPDFIKESTEYYGSSTIVISMEVIRQNDGEYLLFIDNGREHTGVNLKYWLEKVQELGAGEIVVTSVDNDGTMRGLDINLIDLAIEYASVPIIFHGGIGSLSDADILINSQISGLAIASAFHYNYLPILKSSDADYSEGNVDFIEKQSHVKKGFSIPDLKIYLNKRGVSVRNS
ncbi:MAG: imidazole glycerol phosphate synthase subunit HisF [Candidatus Marinimicrobia bacterium]|nr:imidazole glycerol phosphate synthase subunit HisF [Candidatus Neomarinimicrobiota bacterium]